MKTMYDFYGPFAEERYDRSKVASFCKVDDPWGIFSNMSAYEVTVGGRNWRTTEALYQALRFPDHPDVQQRVWEQKSPMSAKMVTKPHRAQKSRADWDDVRVAVMEWCLRLKLAQQWRFVYWKLKESAPQPIVEISTKGDQFWGTRAEGEKGCLLVGSNVLGRLWMRLRDEVLGHPETDATILKTAFASVPQSPVEGLRLFGELVT
jgi:ribA/ribD-fused uncharacterized protein